MSYIENFAYAVADNHYTKIKSKSDDQPRFMHELMTEEIERGLIRATLEYTGFHFGNTAEVLGMSTATLKKKIKKYDIYVVDFS